MPYIEDRIPWYSQADSDLSHLCTAGLPDQRLIECYRSSLRTRQEIQKAMYEVHAAAFLASCGTSVDIHVPRGDGSRRNFDVLVEIEGTRVSGESKTRKDEFPFNMPEIANGDSCVPVFGGSRATMDPHDAGNLAGAQASAADLHHRATPESTVIRQILLEGLSQLPEHGCNLVLFGQIEGDLTNLEDALAGTEYVEARRNLETGRITHHWKRASNGAFTSPENVFESLSAVLWIRLWRKGDALHKAYRGFLNTRARSPLPPNVIERLKRAIAQRATS